MAVKKVGTGPLPPLPPVEDLNLSVPTTPVTERSRIRPLGAGDQGVNLMAVDAQQETNVDAEFQRLTATLEERVRMLIAKADALQSTLDLTEVTFGDSVELLIRDFMAIIRDCDYKMRKMLLAEFLRRSLEQNWATMHETKRLGQERYQSEQLQNLTNRRTHLVNRTMQVAQQSQIVTDQDVKTISKALEPKPKSWFQFGHSDPLAEAQKALRQLYLQTGKGTGPLGMPPVPELHLKEELF